VSPCKISEQKFETFTIRGRFSLKMLKKFPGLATSGRHISAMITNAKTHGQIVPYGMFCFNFYRYNQSMSFPWAARCVQENIFGKD